MSAVTHPLQYLLEGSIEMSALLVGVIAILLSLHQWLRKAPDKLRRWYKRLTWFMVILEFMSVATALSSILTIGQDEAFVNQVYPWINLLFVITIGLMPLGITVVVYFVFNI